MVAKRWFDRARLARDQSEMTDDVTRRTVLAGGAALGLAAGRAQAQPAPRSTVPATAVGTVTEIVPRRALTDGPLAKGPPVAGVLVSNGRDVVRTGSDGRYSLPVTPGQSIFVVKPAGLRLPIDPATNLVRHSYVHDPEGTPAALGFRYAGLAPTGPLPASIDFELTRVDEPTRFDVVLVTDPQPGIDRRDRIRARCRRLRPHRSGGTILGPPSA